MDTLLNRRSLCLGPVCLAWSLCLLLAGCSTHPPGGSRSDLGGPIQPYVRIDTNVPGVLKLQIAFRQFVPAHGKGPAVWLSGVSHIGDSNYYGSLQRHLDACDLVLFEGISGSPDPAAQSRSAVPEADSSSGQSAAESSREDHSSLQTSLAASLGLVFQLSALDYQRPNFRNSDLTIPELRQVFAGYQPAPGSPQAGERFEGVLRMMEGGSFFDSLLQVALRFLSISPKLQALGRLALMDVIGEIHGDLDQLQGLPPDMKQLLEVLLQRRNAKVLEDLRADLHEVNPHGSIAIFYGTGHMPDLEKHLRQDLKYRPQRQIWFTAFSVDLAKSGVSASERAFVQTLIRQQLTQFQGN